MTINSKVPVTANTAIKPIQGRSIGASPIQGCLVPYPPTGYTDVKDYTVATVRKAGSDRQGAWNWTGGCRKA